MDNIDNLKKHSASENKHSTNKPSILGKISTINKIIGILNLLGIGLILLLIFININKESDVSINPEENEETSKIQKEINTTCEKIHTEDFENTQSEWRAHVRVNNKNEIEYFEVNIENEAICKHIVAKDMVSNITNLDLVVKNYPKESLVYYTVDNTLNMVNVESTLKVQIPLQNEEEIHAFQIHRNNAFQYIETDSGQHLEEFLVVEPITTVEGCVLEQSQDQCASFIVNEQKAWNELNVDIVIVRTDGEYFTLSRSEFPYGTDFGSFNIEKDILTFYSAQDNGSININENIQNPTDKNFQNEYIFLDLPKTLNISEIKSEHPNTVFNISIKDDKDFSMTMAGFKDEDNKTITDFYEDYCINLNLPEISSERCNENYSRLKPNNIADLETLEGSFTMFESSAFYILFHRDSIIYEVTIWGPEGTSPSEESIEKSKDIIRNIIFKPFR